MKRKFSSYINGILLVIVIISILCSISEYKTDQGEFQVLDADVATQFEEDLKPYADSGLEYKCYYSGAQVSSLYKMRDNDGVLVRNYPTKENSEWMEFQDEGTINVLAKRINAEGAVNRTTYRFEGLDSQGNLCFQAIYNK